MTKLLTTKYYYFFFIVSTCVLFNNCIIGQEKQKPDSIRQKNEITENKKISRDFKIYQGLSDKKKNKILKDFIIKLNGCWISEIGVESFSLSETTFKGSRTSKLYDFPSPLTSLDIVDGRIKIISKNSLGEVTLQGNIKINKNQLIFVDDKDNAYHISYRLEQCPN